jgi:uncharacterized protein (UPF0332 family)
VTPEAAAFLDKARECLAKADGMLDRWPDEAGREAYLVGLHATQALIVERTGGLVKTHRGVQRELARLTKDVPEFDGELRGFLGRTYNLKAIADYETGPGAQVSPESARDAIATGKRFVARMVALISIWLDRAGQRCVDVWCRVVSGVVERTLRRAWGAFPSH